MPNQYFRLEATESNKWTTLIKKHYCNPYLRVRVFVKPHQAVVEVYAHDNKFADKVMDYERYGFEDPSEFIASLDYREEVEVFLKTIYS